VVATRAANLNVSISSGGSNSVVVNPGATVNYDVAGVLTDALNEGLALVIFDLSFDGGALSPADTPITLPMSNFTRNEGITNPAGYGGTASGGVLLQVGGAQNTIKNTPANAPFPIGSVITGVAWPSNAVILVSGSLTAPMTQGDYVLSLSNLSSTVIQDGEDGTGPFWAVESSPAGTITNLTITVGTPINLPPTVAAAGPRYLAISPAAGSTPLAFVVTPTCPSGPARYVMAPSGPNNIAALSSNPGDAAFLTPANWGSTVYATGLDVIPETEYGIQADFGTPGNPDLLPPELTTTWKWGDVNDTTVVDVDDIACVLDSFAAIFNCSFYSTDLLDFVPNQVIDVDDIVAVLDSFSAIAYAGPSPCP